MARDFHLTRSQMAYRFQTCHYAPQPNWSLQGTPIHTIASATPSGRP